MYYCICTSPKINMEAEDHHPIARENHVPHLHFWVPCWFSEVYISYDMICLICKICSFAVFCTRWHGSDLLLKVCLDPLQHCVCSGWNLLSCHQSKHFGELFVVTSEGWLILLVEDVLHQLVRRINQNKSISYCFINSCRISFINTKKEP